MKRKTENIHTYIHTYINTYIYNAVPKDGKYSSLTVNTITYIHWYTHRTKLTHTNAYTPAVRLVRTTIPLFPFQLQSHVRSRPTKHATSVRASFSTICLQVSWHVNASESTSSCICMHTAAYKCIYGLVYTLWLSRFMWQTPVKLRMDRINIHHDYESGFQGCNSCKHECELNHAPHAGMHREFRPILLCAK